MRRLALPLILGLAHGVADGVAGLLLGGLPRTIALEQVALLILLYNALAFGGQPLVGLVADRLGRPRAAALAGLALLAAALAASAWQPRAAVALAGLGSAAFHIGGGARALCATRGRAAGPGLFAAPGVIGLAVGGALAASGLAPIGPGLALLGALAGAIALLELPALPYPSKIKDQPKTKEADDPSSFVLGPSSHVEFETHDLIMLVLLAGIALRSAVWSSLSFLFAGRYDLLIAMAVAAAAGKVAGGLLADRLGWRRWAAGALVLAAPLLALGGQRAVPLLIGVALLQSATPAALAATLRLLPKQPATAAGLALGLAVAIGGLPAAGGLSLSTAPPVLLAVLLAAALALWWAFGQVGGRAGRGARGRDVAGVSVGSAQQ
jgi:FSR family fosmidomycin resistance protein-like MFS transporter